jgi:alkanesulfonate monooxygenase SsuD/methylene tetrahydromethanopterin reductase-like flavin-dependent oxidoreductase (luciferase family)
MVVAQRNPTLVAKQAAALDFFSDGRLILGFGAGWAKREFGFLNTDFARRERLMDEGIKLMKALWRDRVVNFNGEFLHVKDALSLPKPVKKDMPVWIGGNGSAETGGRLGFGMAGTRSALEQRDLPKVPRRSGVRERA